MKAMILAAGMGTRLGSLTKERPKALVEIARKPLLALLLEKLRSQEISGVVVNAYYQADQIERFVKEGSYPAGWARVLIEERLLGTGGGVGANENPKLVSRVRLHLRDQLANDRLERHVPDVGVVKHLHCGILLVL